MNGNEHIKSAIGYLSKSGKKIDFICPYCGWVHSRDANTLRYKVYCIQPQNPMYVQIVELKKAPIPVDLIIEAKNTQIKEYEAAEKQKQELNDE